MAHDHEQLKGKYTFVVGLLAQILSAFASVLDSRTLDDIQRVRSGRADPENSISVQGEQQPLFPYA